MQHMGNVRLKLIPLFYMIPIIVFGSYRLYEDKFISNLFIKSTKGKITSFLNKNIQIHGIIYGGSNAIMGISAEQLSIYSRKKIYNLSLYNEGAGQVDLHEYLKETIPHPTNKRIEFVLYSSINIYNYSSPKKTFTSILPSKRLMGLIIDLFELRNIPLYPFESTQYGDYLFHEKPNVKFRNKKIILPPISQALHKIKTEKQAINRIFPNAKFIVIFPPIYSPTNIRFFENYLKELSKELNNNQISFIHGTFERNINQFGIDDRHLNAFGRIRHTKELYDSLKQKIL